MMIHGLAKEKKYLSGEYAGLQGNVPHGGAPEHKIGFVQASFYGTDIHNILTQVNEKFKLGISNEKINDIIFTGHQ